MPIRRDAKKSLIDVKKDERQQSKQARTKSGDEVTYQEIRGKLEYYALVNVLIVDRDGDVLLDDHVD